MSPLGKGYQLSGGCLPADRGFYARRTPSESGLTLIELLIALALLAFVLLGIVPLFLASVKANYSGNEYTSIHILARDRLEQLMNLPFLDTKLAPGFHGNDQPAKLPSPTNPSALSNVPNPFQIAYQVSQYQVPNADINSGAVPANQPFTPTLVAAAGAPYHYKRIDVTVAAHVNGALGSGAFSVAPFGIGTRVARVTGCLNNPSPTVNLSVAPCVGTCP